MKRGGSLLPDTNVILRYLLQDDLHQFAEIEATFEAVRTGADQAIILESVLVECLYVLTRAYKVPKEKAAGALIGLLQ